MRKGFGGYFFEKRDKCERWGPLRKQNLSWASSAGWLSVTQKERFERELESDGKPESDKIRKRWAEEIAGESKRRRIRWSWGRTRSQRCTQRDYNSRTLLSAYHDTSSTFGWLPRIAFLLRLYSFLMEELIMKCVPSARCSSFNWPSLLRVSCSCDACFLLSGEM